MADSTDPQLDQETSAWCDRAEAFVERAGDDTTQCLAIVREGIFLRRRWDRFDRDATPRRRLLRLLAAAQNVCHRRLAELVSDAGDAQSPPPPERVEHMIRRLAEDDRYLAELLADHDAPPESIAFAVECFRDDVHWLGTLVALLDGTRGIDFTGRVLLEQESLQRAMQSWEDTGPAAAGCELREAARRLRAAALARRSESLLNQPQPEDLRGWYRTWQSGGRLMMRPKGATGDEELERRVRELRATAIDRWKELLAELSPERRNETLRETVDDLADTAAESLTFLEDLPLDEAVLSLEILSEDAAICMKVIRDSGDAELQKLRRRLRRRQKTVAAELQERRLGWRMESLFGHTAVALLERTILFLLLAFVVLLAVEGPLIRFQQAHWPDSIAVEATCAWIDLGICLVFLTEFSLKLFLARPRGLYFRRNWITGLVPAIPVGFIAYIVHPDRFDVVEAGEAFVLLRGLRYLRLPQMARWLRIARPVLRAARLVAFTVQASDRLVRRFAPLLNRNLVLFERAAIRVDRPRYQTELAALRERFYYRASEVITGLPQPARLRLVRARIEDLTAMLSAPGVDMVAPASGTEGTTTREIPLESLIARLLAATPAGISDRIGRTLARSVARWCRAFDVFGVRRLPVIRDLVAAGMRSSPYEATAQVANRIGVLLKHLLDRVYWLADLYGTVTAPQLVDSIGDWMVKRTARPARRFLMFGIAFLAVSSLAGTFVVLGPLSDTLNRVVVAPLVVLGILCLLPLCVGLWFRRIAGEATDFFSHVAEAQFIGATKKLKHRFAKRHHAILHRRVIAPEAEMAGQKPHNPTPAGDDPRDDPRHDPIRAAVEMLFEDYLDGAPFHAGDTKISTQLLGNLTLISLRETRLGYGRRRRKHLQRLDLAASQSTWRGPYLWFHFISRSLAQQTAKLVVDYNAHALPLDRAAAVDDGQVRRYVQWLSGRLRVPVDQIELPAEFELRWNDRPDATQRPAAARRGRHRRGFEGNDFTAVHFLSADAEVEADVRRRYGDGVADLMRRDRRDNIRRVFRTYPFHRRSKGQRTFNPLAVHTRYIAGGRIFLLPLRMASWGMVLAVRGVRLFWKFVREVLNPTVGDLPAVEEPDPYAVAVRKIHRMRKPAFFECLRMRADFDPEYLGVSPPGSTAYVRRATVTPIEEDLELIDADPGIRQRFRRLATQRRRQMLEFRRVAARFGCRDRSIESLRAMAIAYAIDYGNARSRLEATERLDRTFMEAARDPSTVRWSIRAWWCRWRYAGRMNRLFAQPPFDDYNTRQRKLSVRLLCRRRGVLLDALRTLTRKDVPSDPAAGAKETLLAVARDPSTWTRQLVVLRAVQTLSVLDLQTYCDLVAELGEYGPCTPDAADDMIRSSV